MRSIIKMQIVNRGEFIRLACLTTVVGLSNAFLIYLLGGSLRADPAHIAEQAIQFALCLALAVFGQIVLFGQLVSCSERFLRDFRCRFADLILSSRFAAFETMDRSSLITANTHDAVVVSQVLPILVSALVSGLTIVLSLVYLAVTAPFEFLLCALVIALGLVLYKVQMKRALALAHSARTGQDRLYSLFGDLVGGMKELKIDNRLARLSLMPLYHEEAETFLKLNRLGQMAIQKVVATGNGVFLGLIGLVTFGYPLLNGADSEKRAIFLVVLIYLIGPLMRILASVSQINNAVVATQRILALQERLAAEAEHPHLPQPDGIAAAGEWTRLVFDGVTYRHAVDERNEFVLGPLSMRIARGELIFLVGSNGAGKSTLGKLLTGLYLPSAGRILLDGAPIGGGNIGEYRTMIGAVFNDNYLFERLARRSPDLQLRLAAKLDELGYGRDAQAIRQRMEFDRLSTGQRRRVSLALLCLDDKPIIFLDEWAADQDPESRRHFYDSVLPGFRAQGKTVVLVSHDDRYFAVADRVIRLGDGKIAEVSAGALDKTLLQSQT